MSKIPTELKYTQEHEWIKIVNGIGIIGITDFAQESLGDITFIELPSPGSSFKEGDTFGVIESVKAASDLYMPVSGDIQEVNGELESAPELANDEPYEGGWLIKIKISDEDENESLLSAPDYEKFLEE